MDERLKAARDLMRNVTPLNTDCGRRCGAACCEPDEDGRGGMLLFPTEETLYAEPSEGFEITETEEGLLLTCDGECDRDLRPLSCMLFPLWIFGKEDGGFEVRQDRRGFYVCPMARGNMNAFSPAFVKAVREAGEILWQDEKHRAFLTEVGRMSDRLSEF